MPGWKGASSSASFCARLTLSSMDGALHADGGVRSPARLTGQRSAMAAMKWWGWGDEGVAFTHEGQPALGPFLLRHLGLDVNRIQSRAIAFGDLDIPEPSLSPELTNALQATGDVSTDPLDRVVHARGKSLRD